MIWLLILIINKNNIYKTLWVNCLLNSKSKWLLKWSLKRKVLMPWHLINKLVINRKLWCCRENSRYFCNQWMRVNKRWLWAKCKLWCLVHKRLIWRKSVRVVLIQRISYLLQSRNQRTGRYSTHATTMHSYLTTRVEFMRSNTALRILSFKNSLQFLKKWVLDTCVKVLRDILKISYTPVELSLSSMTI